MKEKFVVSILLPLITNLFSFIANYILILNLEINYVEEWTFINSVISLGFLFGDLGLNSIHYQYVTKKDYEQYFGTFFTIRLIIIGLNISTAVILITFLELWTSAFIPYLMIVLFTTIIINSTEIFIRNLKSKKKIFKSEIPKFIVINLNNSATLTLALFLNIINDPLLWLSCINLFSNGLYILSLILISKSDLVIKKPEKDIALEYARDVKPLVAYSILFILTENLGNLILYYAIGANSLAYFTIIYNYIITILLLISRSITDIYQVQYAHYFKQQDTNSIEKLTHTVEKYSSIFFLSVIIITVLNGNLIFYLFLPNYLDAVPILYILIFVPYLSGISLPYVRQMVAGKKQKQQALFDTLNRLLRLILILILIPKTIFTFPGFNLGIIGYALAILIPWINLSIFYRIFIKKYFNIDSQKRILLHFILAIISLLISYLIKYLLIEPFFGRTFYTLLFSSGILLALFIAFLIMVKELNKTDLKLFIEILNLKGYFRSFKEEFN